MQLVIGFGGCTPPPLRGTPLPTSQSQPGCLARRVRGGVACPTDGRHRRLHGGCDALPGSEAGMPPPPLRRELAVPPPEPACSGPGVYSISRMGCQAPRAYASGVRAGTGVPLACGSDAGAGPPPVWANTRLAWVLPLRLSGRTSHSCLLTPGGADCVSGDWARWGCPG